MSRPERWLKLFLRFGAVVLMRMRADLGVAKVEARLRRTLAE